MPEAFHLLEPAWLLLAIPAVVLLWWRSRPDGGRGPWSGVVDRPLQPLLLTPARDRQARLPLWLLGLGWLLGLIALANPAWERVPAPLWSAGPARVVVLDLSRSMLAADLRPTRLFQARLKVEDLLSVEDSAEIGLVVFAGDAFTVAPLTRDAATLRALLKVLEPGLMPAQGSRVDLALIQAHDLLRQAGVANGEVILITDGVEDMPAALDAAAQLHEAGHRVSLLGVGSGEGAPLPGGRAGRPFVVGLDTATLAAIAEAGGGRYATLSPVGGDISALLRGDSGDGQTSDGLQTWRWHGRGILLVLVLLPLAAIAFRRGWLMTLLLVTVLPWPSQPAFASVWDDAWARSDQQAAEALADGRYDRAQLAVDPMVRGAAAYRLGQYAEAEQAFAAADGADAAYNRGNALARMGRYREAVVAYDTALNRVPGMADAVHNKAAVEALLQGQQQLAQREQKPPSEREDEQATSEESASSRDDDAQEQADQASQDGQQVVDDGAEDGDANPGDTEAEAAEEQAGGDSDADAQGDDRGGETDTTQGEDAGEQAGQTESAASDAGADGEGQSGDGAGSANAGGSQLSSASTGGREHGDPSRQGERGTSASDTGDSSDPDASEPGKQVADADRVEDQGEPGRQSQPQGQQALAGDKQHDRSGTGESDEQSSAGGPQDRVDGRGSDVGESFAEANRRLDGRLGDDARQHGEADDDFGASPEAGGVDRVGNPDETTGEPAPGGTPGGTLPMLAAPSLSVEEKLAAQQWLRRIPDDPGGLLRRKFLLQYRQRGRVAGANAQDW